MDRNRATLRRTGHGPEYALKKIRSCFFKADKSKMVNSESVSATTQHIEAPVYANNNYPIN